MSVEAILKEMKDSLEAIQTGKTATDQQVAAMMLKFAEIETAVATMKSERVAGFDGAHAFKTQEQQEAIRFKDFFNAAVARDLEKIKTMNSEIDADGGILVPEEFRPRILRIIETYGMARKMGTTIPMKTDKITMPTLTDGVAVYWGNGSSQAATLGGQAWTGLGADGIPESQPSFGSTSLTIDDLYCLVPIANQLLDDAVVDIVNLIVQLIGEAFAKEEDRMAFMGDELAGDPFTGVMIAASNVITIDGDAFTDLTADDLADMIDAIDGDDTNCEYIMHATVFNVIRKLKDKNDNYIFQPPTTDGPGTIWGYPYRKIRNLPRVGGADGAKPFVGFGNFKNLYIADRQQLTIATSTHVGFKKNQTFIRAHERIGFKLAVPSTIAVLQTELATTTE